MGLRFRPDDMLVLAVDVDSARPLELLPLCSGIVCLSSLREAATAAGLVSSESVDAARGAGGGGGGALGSLLTIQSRAMCPALPQTRHMMLAVKLRCSGQSYLR